MIRPTEQEFFERFNAKTEELILWSFGYISAPSWKCNFSNIPPGTINWTYAPRVYITDEYVSITNDSCDKRFHKKFHYHNYDVLCQLLDELIPYIKNVVTNHNGWDRRDREMRKYNKLYKKDKENKGKIF